MNGIKLRITGSNETQLLISSVLIDKLAMFGHHTMKHILCHWATEYFMFVRNPFVFYPLDAKLIHKLCYSLLT